ncbi:hypothetical protein CLOM_g16691 [Closterium sp. NIES-68]|nr:hypothetical protein CLOM_g16691 [Closterium sp. NIES-68]GJP82811.1 hypothetical protein CLOP_g13040 [Closterium sp. NIES-67]
MASREDLPSGSVAVMSEVEVMFTFIAYAIPVVAMVSYHKRSTEWYHNHMAAAFGPDWRNHSPVAGLRAANEEASRGKRLPTLPEHPEEEQEGKEQQEGAEGEEGEKSEKGEEGKEKGRQQKHQEGQKGEQEAKQEGKGKGGLRQQRVSHRSLFNVRKLSSPAVFLPAIIACLLALPLALGSGLIGFMHGVVWGPQEAVTAAVYGAAAGGLYPFHLLGILRDQRHAHED